MNTGKLKSGYKDHIIDKNNDEYVIEIGCDAKYDDKYKTNFNNIIDNYNNEIDNIIISIMNKYNEKSKLKIVSLISVLISYGFNPEKVFNKYLNIYFEKFYLKKWKDKKILKYLEYIDKKDNINE
jgi:hypothetical protein